MFIGIEIKLRLKRFDDCKSYIHQLEYTVIRPNVSEFSSKLNEILIQYLHYFKAKLLIEEAIEIEIRRSQIKHGSSRDSFYSFGTFEDTIFNRNNSKSEFGMKKITDSIQAKINYNQHQAAVSLLMCIFTPKYIDPEIFNLSLRALGKYYLTFHPEFNV